MLLLVLCKDQATARWASGPFAFGFGGWTALKLTPLVLGPENVPVVVKPEEAEADLALAAFSAITHGRSRQITAILDALAQALGRADREAIDYYSEFLEVGLHNTPACEYWRDLMRNGSYFPGRGTLAEQKYLEGKADGKAEGKVEGKAEGKAEERADFVLRLMTMRGLELSADDQRRVRHCKDLDTLARWIDRAVSVNSAGELFAEPETAAGKHGRSV